MGEAWTIDIKAAIDEYYGNGYSWNPTYDDESEN